MVARAGRLAPGGAPRGSAVTARAAGAALPLAAVVGLRVWLSHHGRFPGDRYALAHLRVSGASHNTVHEVVEFLGTLGSAPIAAATVAIVAILIARRAGGRAAVGVLLATLVVGLVAVLKGAWGPTPLWHALHPHHGANYPSGHTAYATAVFGYLALLGARRRQPDLAVLALLVVVAMGPALVLSGAHLVSDVVGGYLLGGAWLILVSACLPPPTRTGGRRA